MGGGAPVAYCRGAKKTGAAKRRCMNTCGRRLDATLDELHEFDADVTSSEEGAEMAERQLGGASVAYCRCAKKTGAAKRRCMNTCGRRLDATLDELNEFDADVTSSEEG